MTGQEREAMTREQIDQDQQTAFAAIEQCLKLHTSHEGRDQGKRDALKAAFKAIDRLHAAAVKAVEPQSLESTRAENAVMRELCEACRLTCRTEKRYSENETSCKNLFDSRKRESRALAAYCAMKEPKP